MSQPDVTSWIRSEFRFQLGRRLGRWELIRWRIALRIYKLGCWVAGRHDERYQYDEAWKVVYCPHCGHDPEDE